MIGRFISADTTDVLLASPTALTDKNLYAYCDNNPVMRKDENGKFWVTVGKIAVALVTQYAGDVIGNVVAGKTGADIFKPTSSVGKYIAAGVTAVIPGSSFTKNIVAEGIAIAEKAIKGEQINLKSSLKNVITATITDKVFDRVNTKVTNYIMSKNSKTYSRYAGEQYKKYPGITQQQIRKKASRIYTWRERITSSAEFVLGSLRSALP